MATIYTRLSRRLLNTLENHTTMKWFNGLNPGGFSPNLHGQEILVFAWDSGTLTWSWLGHFEKDDRYLKVRQDEFARWCVSRFAKE